MALDKGLNLQAPKILAPEGSVLDSLNYEQVDFQGQKRIDGYARYDGSALSSFDDFILLGPDVTYDTGEDGRGLVYNADSGKLFGIDLGVYTFDAVDYQAVVVLDETSIPDAAEWGVDVIEDPEEHYTVLLELQSSARNYVESLPGGIIGLHWFRDRLYAVADLRVLRILDNEGLPDIKPNDILNDIYLALSTVYLSGSLYVLTDMMSVPSTVLVARTGLSYSVESGTAGIMASFWEARTEQQVLNETEDGDSYDFGWKFNHLGWAVPFAEGNSQYGSLTSLNQNRQGVGVQGPTSISGDNGKPLVLVQKVNITNLPAQVNGWKTSTSPNVFNLEADALEDVDNYTIYADAFFSWDGTTGEVVAPGITGEGLTEYPANNSVVVDV
jgi:hypothetical protein